MKIGIDISALSSKSTGTGRFINCLLEQLESYNIEHEKFSPNITNFTIALSYINGNTYTKLNRHLYREILLKKEMYRKEIDCAIFPDYFMPHKFNLPSAIVIHDLSFITHPQFFSKKFILFYTAKLNDSLSQNPVVAVVSENTKRNVKAHLNVKEENIFLLQGYPKIASTNMIRRNESSKPYLLSVGHIEPRKNLLFMINNFILWKNSRNVDLKLKLAGELWINNAETKKLFRMYNNHPDVELLGYVNEEELISLYVNASGFLQTSFVEGFGFPVAEAMKYGLPVLCSRGTACEEISFPYSVTVNPSDNFSFLKGLDELYILISDKRNIRYPDKYSSRLMKSQLEIILNRLKEKLHDKKIFFPSRSANVDEAIEKTLLYAKLHNSGINKHHFHERLFDVKVTGEKLNEALIKLYVDGKIFLINDEVLIDPLPVKFAKKRKTEINSKKINFVLKLINQIPFISCIAFSGGSAHYGFDDHDDIDLFIITKKHTLYISYFLIHLISLLSGSRKIICANYLMDESRLTIRLQRDYYTAYQIISLKSFKNEALLKYFFIKNKWIQNYFPNFKIEIADFRTSGAFFLAPFNRILFSFYKILYKKKLIPLDEYNSIIISEHCLKLHTNDHRIKTIEAFEKMIKKYKNRKINPTEVKTTDSKTAVGM